EAVDAQEVQRSPCFCFDYHPPPPLLPPMESCACWVISTPTHERKTGFIQSDLRAFTHKRSKSPTWLALTLKPISELLVLLLFEDPKLITDTYAHMVAQHYNQSEPFVLLVDGLQAEKWVNLGISATLARTKL
ncbi:hypothetical protein ATANTOWER_023238, partial [Ataeniobius toweri]|nr:hypothetical protein [Ataeniobius toweri]